jgi:hypothetical protein
MTARSELLAHLLVANVSGAEKGHCLRVDDLDLEHAAELQSAATAVLAGLSDGARALVKVLDRVGSDERVTIEEAIGIRNDSNSVFILLVPPTLAREASSLDNAFQRVPYATLLEDAANHVADLIRAQRPEFPANELLRLVRDKTPIEHWLEFLEVTHDEPDAPFGRHLWRIGLMPDGGDDDDARSRLRDNNAFVRKVTDPAGAGQAVRDRLRQTKLAAGPQFEQILAQLAAHEDRLNDSREWTKAIGDDLGLTFDKFTLAETSSESDLEGLEVLPFRSATGAVPKSSGLVASPDGNLVCELMDDEGKVVVKWRTSPAKTTRVHRWLLQLVHPDDLRTPDEAPLHELRVPGSSRSATLKLLLDVDAVTGGFLFIVEVTPLDEYEQPIELPDSAVTQTEAFELVFRDSDEGPEDQPRAATAPSLGAARLHAVTRGAGSAEEAHPAWDRARQQFSLRIGTSRSVQIPLSTTVVELERQTVDDPSITAYSVTSPYGLAVEFKDFVAERSDLPATLSRKRRQIMDMLRKAEPRDVPEVFAWTDDGRAAAQDYLGTYKRALDSVSDETAMNALLRLDTVDVTLGSSLSESPVTVALPLHPLRLAWLSAYDALTRDWAEEILDRASTAAERKDLVDLDAFARVAPTNIPFSLLTPQHKLNVYFDELTFGLGIYLPPDHKAPEVLAATVSRVLGLVRESAARSSDAAMIGDRLLEYRKAHAEPKAIRLAAMNPGDGAVVADALRSFIERSKSDAPRLDVVAYGMPDRYTEPLAALTKLQVDREDQQLLDPTSSAAGSPRVKQSPLFPPIGVVLRAGERAITDDDSVHVSVVSGISELTQMSTPDLALNRFASLEDLLCPLVTTSTDEAEGTWSVSPALNPRTASSNASLVLAHRSHQTAAGTRLGFDGPPALRVGVSGDTLDAIRVLHERSDWVLTLDRFVGLNFYESGNLGLGTANYILDYAPDFIDGMSHRLTVTTSHRNEVTEILKRAMTELGLDALDSSSTQVLNDLMTVSGRLILRLQSSEGFARESVSLAALISHLRRQSKLDGAIVVPVDSHQEIFGRNALGNESGRRCDMLIVRVTQRKFSIECLEVKSRRHAALPTDLADDIADQLESTKTLLEQRYFAIDPARVDAPLQRAQLAGILHYYADRAVSNGLISSEKVTDTHKYIDSLIEGAGVEVEISLHGYVISLGGREGIPATHRGIPISVLTAADLGRLGFSVPPDATFEGEFAEEEQLPEEPRGTEGPQLKDEVVEPEVAPEAVPHGTIDTDQALSSSSNPSESQDAEPERSATPAASETGHEISAVERPDGGRTPGGRLVGASSVSVTMGRDTSGLAVTWTPSTKGSPHAFIVGIPGQGKSVTTRRLIRELAAQGLPSLVIDFHGDMASAPPANAEVLRADNGLPFTPFEAIDSDQPARINQAAWELAEVIQFVGEMGEIQRSNVYKALQQVYKKAGAENRVPTLSEFATDLEAVEQGGRAKNARERVRPLTDFGLFDESASRRFSPREAGMVVDLSRLMLEEVQIAATSFLLRKVYRDMFSWLQDGTLKLAIVLDEAHRVAKDVTLPRLMKEGRKYGVLVVVASQGLADFHPDVLGNAGTKIVFRTNHPESKAVARYLRGRAGQDLSIEVEKLGVGQAYVSTTETPQARRTQMLE